MPAGCWQAPALGTASATRLDGARRGAGPGEAVQAAGAASAGLWTATAAALSGQDVRRAPGDWDCDRKAEAATPRCCAGAKHATLMLLALRARRQSVVSRHMGGPSCMPQRPAHGGPWVPQPGSLEGCSPPPTPFQPSGCHIGAQRLIGCSLEGQEHLLAAWSGGSSGLANQKCIVLHSSVPGAADVRPPPLQPALQYQQ